MRNFPTVPLVLLAATFVYALPATGKTMCVSEKGRLLVKPTDPQFCSCIARFSPRQIEQFRLDAGAVDECLLTTGSLGNFTLLSPPTSIDPPVINPPPVVNPPPGPLGGKRNNGLGNGSDPAPPGIGNAGNDGGDVAVGSVAVSPGAPGGSATAPGQNK